VLDGVEVEYGSPKETLAIFAKKRQNSIRRLETLINVKSNMLIAQAVVNPSEIETKSINKLMDQYDELMFPEIAREREKKSKEVGKMMRGNRKALRIHRLPAAGDNRRLSRKTKNA